MRLHIRQSESRTGQSRVGESLVAELPEAEGTVLLRREPQSHRAAAR